MNRYRVTYTRGPLRGGRFKDGASTGSVTKTSHVVARHASAAAEIVLRRDGLDWEMVSEVEAVQANPRKPLTA